MSQNFKTQEIANRFAEDLLNTLNDTYYVWTDDSAKSSWIGSVKKATMARYGRQVPAKAEETITGQSLSYAIQLLRDNGWKNLSNFESAAEETGFTVRRFANMTVITL